MLILKSIIILFLAVHVFMYMETETLDPCRAAAVSTIKVIVEGEVPRRIGLAAWATKQDVPETAKLIKDRGGTLGCYEVFFLANYGPQVLIRQMQQAK